MTSLIEEISGTLVALVGQLFAILPGLLMAVVIFGLTGFVAGAVQQIM